MITLLYYYYHHYTIDGRQIKELFCYVGCYFAGMVWVHLGSKQGEGQIFTEFF